MKQKVLFLMMLLCLVVGKVDAQTWTWTGETPAANGSYYLYNVGFKGFLNYEGSISVVENNNPNTLWKFSNASSGTISTSYNNKNYYIYVEKTTTGGSASIRTNSATVTIAASSITNNAYKFQHTKTNGFFGLGNGTRYFNVENHTSVSAASTNDVNNDWLLISETQKVKYDAYIAAYNEASTYVNGLTDTELKNYLQTNIINANNSAQYSDADDKTQALKSVKDYVKVPLNVNTMGSFVAPFDVELPEGVTAWITNDSKVSDGYLTITQVALTEGKLPANTPVILRGTGKQTYYGKTTGTRNENENGNGFLVGVYKDTTVPQGNYVLQKQTDEIMLYKVESEDITLKAYRAYLDGSMAKDAKLRLLFSDETTVIANVDEKSSISAIYSVSGAKLSAVQKGLNIIKMSDGSVKKVMVK